MKPILYALIDPPIWFQDRWLDLPVLWRSHRLAYLAWWSVLAAALALALTTVGCVGAFQGATFGPESPRHFAQLRWAELTDAEKTKGCSFADWNPPNTQTGVRPLGPDAMLVLWIDDRGGLIELDCPGEPFQRSCVYSTERPFKDGMWKNDVLIGCKRFK